MKNLQPFYIDKDLLRTPTLLYVSYSFFAPNVFLFVFIFFFPFANTTTKAYTTTKEGSQLREKKCVKGIYHVWLEYQYRITFTSVQIGKTFSRFRTQLILLLLCAVVLQPMLLQLLLLNWVLAQAMHECPLI